MRKNVLVTKFPYKLQFFAADDGAGNSGTTEGGEQNQEDVVGQGEQEITVESVMADLKAERAARAKDKAALDNALKKVGDMTKTIRSMQTAEEQAAEVKREQEEQHNDYVKGLENKLALIEAKSRFASMGMDELLAEATAKAELEGDKDTVTSNIKKATDALIKKKEAEWLKSRPAPQGGNDDGACPVTKEQFDNYGYAKRFEFKQKYPEAYKDYTK